MKIYYIICLVLLIHINLLGIEPLFSLRSLPKSEIDEMNRQLAIFNESDEGMEVNAQLVCVELFRIGEKITYDQAFEIEYSILEGTFEKNKTNLLRGSKITPKDFDTMVTDIKQANIDYPENLSKGQSKNGEIVSLYRAGEYILRELTDSIEYQSAQGGWGNKCMDSIRKILKGQGDKLDHQIMNAYLSKAVTTNIDSWVNLNKEIIRKIFSKRWNSSYKKSLFSYIAQKTPNFSKSGKLENPLSRKWKSAKGESVYGTVLGLKDGIIKFVNNKNKLFTFKESILDKNDIKFLHDNIILLDISNFQDPSSQPKNASEILERIQKTYEKGNAYAAYALALAYKNGCGVEINLDTALKYMEEAAQKGITEAQKSMGDYYYSNWENTNILLNQNKDATKVAKALEWYEKSAKNGNRPAMIMCAKILYPENINKAYEWAIRAYNLKYEDENRCEMLAASLLCDIEMHRNERVNALKWYKIATKFN